MIYVFTSKAPPSQFDFPSLIVYDTMMIDTNNAETETQSKFEVRQASVDDDHERNNKQRGLHILLKSYSEADVHLVLRSDV